MATAAQASVFLGTLVGVMVLFNVLPGQYNAKIYAYTLLHVLTVLILLLSLVAQRFSNPLVGFLALMAAVATLAAGGIVYRSRETAAQPPFTATNLVLETVTICLVFGSAGLGLYS